MLEIEFSINGKKVQPDQMGNAIEKAMMETIQDNFRGQAQGMTCKEHGEGPRLRLQGRDLEHLSLEVNGCCDTFVKEVSDKLSDDA